MYQRTERQRAAIETTKRQRWIFSYQINPMLGGNGHQRYARYVEWCRTMRLPAAPIGVWACINDKLQG